MDCILASGTWKNSSFYLGPAYSQSVNPWRNLVVPPSSLGDVSHHWWCFEGIRIGSRLLIWSLEDTDRRVDTDIWHPLVFQNAEDTGLVSLGWEDRYTIRSYPPESFFYHCCHRWTLLDTSDFFMCQGAIHLTGFYSIVSCSRFK
jgi:hypothetical protein